MNTEVIESNDDWMNDSDTDDLSVADVFRLADELRGSKRIPVSSLDMIPF